MTIIGLFATAIICGTIITTTWLATRHAISFRIIRTNETPTVIQEQDNEVPAPETMKEIPFPEKPLAGMDEVVHAVNRLMGVEDTDEGVNNNGTTKQV